MKIKILSKISLRDKLLIVLAAFFSWVFLRAILPNYPMDLTDPYNLCDSANILEITQANRKDIKIFKCEAKVPLEVLFRARQSM